MSAPVLPRQPLVVLALIALLAAALWLRLAIAWEQPDVWVARATSDDAYYYFQIARHLAEGRGASFDGHTPTNGFHPLWLLLCSAAQAIWRDPVAAVRASLALGALLGTATVAFTFAVVRSLSDRDAAALLAAAFVALQPRLVTESVNGLETALAVCLLAWLVWLHVGMLRSPAPPRPGTAALFGAVAGALLLARTDMALVWLAVWLHHAVRALRRGGPRAWLAPCLAALLSAVCVAPWLAWNLARFGSVVQVSAIAIPEPLREDFLARHGSGIGVVVGRSVSVTRRALLHTLVHLYALPRALPAWPAWLGGAALLAWMLALPPRRARARSRRRLRALLAPMAGVAALLLVHTALRWWVREWYFAPAGWLLAVAGGLAVAHASDALAELGAARSLAAVLPPAAAAGLLALLWWTPAWRGDLAPASPHRLQQLEAARWLREHTAADARIGSFNAGILGYFSGRVVVNLDGAVNAEAYRARRSGHLLDYALAERLDYVADWRGTLPALGCDEHAAVRCPVAAVIGQPLPGFAGAPLLVLRLETAGARP